MDSAKLAKHVKGFMGYTRDYVELSEQWRKVFQQWTKLGLEMHELRHHVFAGTETERRTRDTAYREHARRRTLLGAELEDLAKRLAQARGLIIATAACPMELLEGPSASATEPGKPRQRKKPDHRQPNLY